MTPNPATITRDDLDTKTNAQRLSDALQAFVEACEAERAQVRAETRREAKETSKR